MIERFTPHSRWSLFLAKREAQQRHATLIDAEHLLLGLLQDHDGGAAHLLSQSGLDVDQLRAEVENRLPHPLPSELEHLVRILTRRTKSNPVLIGAPGVGKTPLVEGLAQRIAKCDVPPEMAQTRIVTLDLGSMVADSQHRGELDTRLKALMQEVVFYRWRRKTSRRIIPKP